MTRRTAIINLIFFAGGALLCVIWGLSDIISWIAAAKRCDRIIAIEPSSFWFIGFLSITGLLMLLVFRSRRAHAVIFTVLCAWFSGAPLTFYYSSMSQLASAGYDISAASPFNIDTVELQLENCNDPVAMETIGRPIGPAAGRYLAPRVSFATGAITGLWN